MTQDILDTIDHTLDDVLSSDAMRWTPDLHSRPVDGLQAVRWMATNGVVLTGWQAELIRQRWDRAARQVNTAMVRFVADVSPFMEAMAKAVRLLSGLRTEVDQEKRIRIRRMHTAYGRKQRKNR